MANRKSQTDVKHPDENLVSAVHRALEKPCTPERLRALLGLYMERAQLAMDFNSTATMRLARIEAADEAHTALFWEWMKDA